MLSSAAVGCCQSENANAESGARIRQKARRRRTSGNTSEPQQKTKFSPAKQRKVFCGRVAPLWLCLCQWASFFSSALPGSILGQSIHFMKMELAVPQLDLPARLEKPSPVIILKEREPVAQ